MKQWSQKVSPYRFDYRNYLKMLVPWKYTLYIYIYISIYYIHIYLLSFWCLSQADFDLDIMHHHAVTCLCVASDCPILSLILAAS